MRALIVVGLLSALSAACSTESEHIVQTGIVPNRVVAVSEGDPAIRVATRAETPIAVQVRGGNDLPVAETTVFFKVLSGPVKVETSETRTDSNGVAFTYLLAQGQVGPAQVEAKVLGLSVGTVTFNVVVVAGDPHRLQVVSGSGQTGTVGTRLSDPVTVRAFDYLGNPVAGATVDFEAQPGFGSFTPASVTTNSEGLASAVWTLGESAQAQTARAFVKSFAQVMVGATAQAGAPAKVQVVGGPRGGVIGKPLDPPLEVRVLDGYQNPIARAPVALSVVSGAADVGAPAATDDASGAARFTVTPQAGESVLEATSGTLKAQIVVRAFAEVALAPARSDFESVSLSWSASTDADFLKYEILRSATASAPLEQWTSVATFSEPETTSHVDTSAALATSYFYRVLTHFQGGFALLSNPVAGRAGVMIELGGKGFDMELSHDRKTLYVSVPSLNQVVAVSMVTFEVERRIAAGSRPEGLSLDAAGTKLYAALNGAGAVSEIDLSTFEHKEIDVGTQLDDPRTFDVLTLADGTVLATSSPDSSGFAYVVRIDPANAYSAQRVASNRIIRARPTLLRSPTDAFVYVGEGFSPNSLYKLDTAQATAPIVLEDAHGSVSGTGAMAISPDGSRIYLGSGQVLRTGSLNQAAVISAGFPMLNADGSRCYVATGGAYYWDYGGDAGPDIKVFDTSTFAQVAAFKAPQTLDRMLLLAEKRILALADDVLFGVVVP